MKNNEIIEINEKIIISKRINDCYLMYSSEEYYLFKPENDKYTTVIINISDNPDEVEDTLTLVNGKSDEDKRISNNKEFNGSLRFLGLHLAMIGFEDEQQGYFIQQAFRDLADVYGGYEDRTTRFKDITDDVIIETIEEVSKKIDRIENEFLIGGIHKALKTRNNVGKAQRELGNYLNMEQGIILRIHSHELYKLDPINNGYNSTSIDEIIKDLTDIFNEKNIFKTDDVEKAVDFISDRLTPEYNIVKFGNGLYDIKQHKMIEPDKPIFTLIETPFNYNPDAKGRQIQDYLESTFERNTPDETDKEIKGVLQVIGYLFTSGNIYNALIFLVGIGGGGKGTLATIISEIFKGKTTQLDFSKIENDTHATSILTGKHLNLVRETRTGSVKDNTTYKLLSGNDPIDVNPKNKSPYELPAEEVPKSILNANNLPNFKNPDKSILQRFVLIEFKKSFRNTNEDIRDLAKLIVNSSDDMEWLIYHSLEAYREMVEAGEDFILRLSESETLGLLYKHSKPLNYLVRKLILKHDPTAFNSDVEMSSDGLNGETEFTPSYILTDELNELIVYLSKKEGVQIPLEKNTGKASRKGILNAIREEFDLFDYVIANGSRQKKYETLSKKFNGESKRYYPELIRTYEYNLLLEEMIENEKDM